MSFSLSRSSGAGEQGAKGGASGIKVTIDHQDLSVFSESVSVVFVPLITHLDSLLKHWQPFKRNIPRLSAEQRTKLRGLINDEKRPILWIR